MRGGGELEFGRWRCESPDAGKDNHYNIFRTAQRDGITLPTVCTRKTVLHRQILSRVALERWTHKKTTLPGASNECVFAFTREKNTKPVPSAERYIRTTKQKNKTPLFNHTYDNVIPKNKNAYDTSFRQQLPPTCHAFVGPNAEP